MRNEHFDRIKRRLDRALDQDRLPMDLDYDPERPWDGVFRAAAMDKDFWDREVRDPALDFITRRTSAPR